MNNEQVFGKLLTVLAQQNNYKLDSFTINIYHKKLIKYNIENINKALGELFESSFKFPTIADIKKQMGIEMITPKQLSFIIATRLSSASSKFGRVNLIDKKQMILDYIGDSKLDCFTDEEGMFSLYTNLGNNSLKIEQCAANLAYKISKLSQEKIDEIHENINSFNEAKKYSESEVQEKVAHVKENFQNDKDFKMIVSEFAKTNNKTLSQFKDELNAKLGVLK